MSDSLIRTLAVALHYEAPDAPRVVATGRGHVGQRIIDVARENGVPLEQNPALASTISVCPIHNTGLPSPLPRRRATTLTWRGYLGSASTCMSPSANPAARSRAAIAAAGSAVPTSCTERIATNSARMSRANC